jgi:predicted O-methyltransferase YrrM
VIDLLVPDEPYFLGKTRGIQGDALHRHPIMSAAVSLQARPGHRLQILEIGSYAGFSALTWAQSIEEFCPEGGDLLCVDPWAAYIDDDVMEQTGRANLDWDATLEQSSMDEIYNLFLHNISFGRSQKVTINHFRAPGLEAMRYLQDEVFDIVYIDGRHVYRHVMADLEAATRLVRKGGFLCGDDLELQLHEVDAAEARAHIGRHVLKDAKTDKEYHVGVALAVADFFGGEVTNYSGFFLMRRTGGRQFEKVAIDNSRTIIPKHWPQGWQKALYDALQKKPG